MSSQHAGPRAEQQGHQGPPETLNPKRPLHGCRLLQGSSNNMGRGDDAAAVILSLLTSRVEEENPALGVLGEPEGETQDLLGGPGGHFSGRLLDTRLTRNTSSVGNQSSPMPLLRQGGNTYNSDSRRWRVLLTPPQNRLLRAPSCNCNPPVDLTVPGNWIGGGMYGV